MQYILSSVTRGINFPLPVCSKHPLNSLAKYQPTTHSILSKSNLELQNFCERFRGCYTYQLSAHTIHTTNYTSPTDLISILIQDHWLLMSHFGPYTHVPFRYQPTYFPLLDNLASCITFHYRSTDGRPQTTNQQWLRPWRILAPLSWLLTIWFRGISLAFSDLVLLWQPPLAASTFTLNRLSRLLHFLLPLGAGLSTLLLRLSSLSNEPHSSPVVGPLARPIPWVPRLIPGFQGRYPEFTRP